MGGRSPAAKRGERRPMSYALRPTYSFFSGLPPVGGAARRPYAVVQLDVEIPEYAAVGAVEVLVYYQTPHEVGARDWHKVACGCAGRYRDSRTTHLYTAVIRDYNVARWFAVMRLDRDSPWTTAATKEAPYRVNPNVQSVYPPPYFTVGFASLIRADDDNELLLNIMVNGTKFGAVPASIPGRLPEVPYKCFCRYTFNKWRTYCDKEMTLVLHNIQRAVLPTDKDKQPCSSDTLLVYQASVDLQGESKQNLECCFFCVRTADILDTYNPEDPHSTAISEDQSSLVSWDNNYGFNYSLYIGGHEIQKLRQLWPRIE